MRFFPLNLALKYVRSS